MPHASQRTKNKRTLVLITAASVTDPVVTLEEARNHLRITTTVDDPSISDMISSATERVETLTERQLVTATWELRLDWFDPVIEIRKNPVISITSVKYVDSAGDTQTISSANYETDTDAEPARVTPTLNQYWPTPKNQLQAVQVLFTTGYGAASAVPVKIKRLIKLIVEQEYWGRWDDPNLQRAIDQLISQVRWVPPL